jgi:ribulose 1,5-bisphosphate synthetase/thiazole synthase
MRNVPAWIESAPIQRFARLQKNTTADVIFVGAGITGITTACVLREAGVKVIAGPAAEPLPQI